MEKVLTKNDLQSELDYGSQPATELLYTRYSGMLYGFVLQFVPEEEEAKEMLDMIFSRLATRLQEACDSDLSIYCWLQAEARKIILDTQKSQHEQAVPPEPKALTVVSRQHRATYFSLLEDASPEHQQVFSQLFLFGESREDLAIEAGKDPARVDRLLKESLRIIRKKLAG